MLDKVFLPMPDKVFLVKYEEVCSNFSPDKRLL